MTGSGEQQPTPAELLAACHERGISLARRGERLECIFVPPGLARAAAEQGYLAALARQRASDLLVLLRREEMEAVAAAERLLLGEPGP